jgi:hypothetical protein
MSHLSDDKPAHVEALRIFRQPALTPDGKCFFVVFLSVLRRAFAGARANPMIAFANCTVEQPHPNFYPTH